MTAGLELPLLTLALLVLALQFFKTAGSAVSESLGGLLQMLLGCSKLCLTTVDLLAAVFQVLLSGFDLIDTDSFGFRPIRVRMFGRAAD